MSEIPITPAKMLADRLQWWRDWTRTLGLPVLRAQGRSLDDDLREAIALLASEAEATARAERAEGALREFITWASSRCPVHEETPDPCPLCGASVARGVCQSVEAIIPQRLLSTARGVLARAALKETSDGE